MKELFFIISTLVITLIIWFGVGVKEAKNRQYVSDEILELSMPINGTIDAGFLDRLQPAYESTTSEEQL